MRPSFVASQEIRDVRELTRYRRTLAEERTREAQRLDKVLQDAGVKLSSVASDVLSVSSRAALGSRSVTCSLGGSVSFSPALMHSGTSASQEVVTVSISASHCSGGTPAQPRPPSPQRRSRSRRPRLERPRALARAPHSQLPPRRSTSRASGPGHGWQADDKAAGQSRRYRQRRGRGRFDDKQLVPGRTPRRAMRGSTSPRLRQTPSLPAWRPRRAHP